MKKIICLLILILVISIGGLKANNVTPDNEISNKKKELVTKIDRNVMAMKLMFTNDKTSELNKKTLYHRYWVVMMDYRHQLDNEKTLEEVESFKKEISEFNNRILQLLNTDTKNLEYELSTIMNVSEIKKIVFK